MSIPRLISYAVDAVATITVVGALTQILPPLAAFLGILVFATRLYEWWRVAVQGKPPRMG